MQKAGMLQTSLYPNGDYIFSITREDFFNSKNRNKFKKSRIKA